MLPVLIRAIGSRLLTREALGALVREEGAATALNVLSSMTTNRKDGEKVVVNKEHNNNIDATPVEKIPSNSEKVGSDADKIFNTKNKSSEFNAVSSRNAFSPKFNTNKSINDYNNTKSAFNDNLNDPVYRAGYQLGQLIRKPFSVNNKNNQEISSQDRKTNELISSILQLFNLTNQNVNKTLIADSFLYEQLEKVGKLINNLSTQISNAYKEKKAQLIEEAARDEEQLQEDFVYRAGHWVGTGVRNVFDKLRPSRDEEGQQVTSDDSSSGHSFGWLSKFGKRGKSSLAPNVKEELTKTGKVRYRDVKTGRFVSKEAAQAVKKQGLLDKGLSVGKGILGKLISPTKKAAVLETAKASKAASLFEKVATKASASSARTAISSGVIRKLATPILEKAIGKTVLKSIPIVGAIVGLGFAAQRLVEGDVVGAGLDAVSGLGGPLTAIPALIASVSRDIYSSVFGVQPEEDPNFGTNIGKVTDSVKEIAEEMIKGQIENSPVQPQQPPTATNPKVPVAANDNVNAQAVPVSKPSPSATEASKSGTNDSSPESSNSETGSTSKSSTNDGETGSTSKSSTNDGETGSTSKSSTNDGETGSTAESNTESSITPAPALDKQNEPIQQPSISPEQLSPADVTRNEQSMQMAAEPQNNLTRTENDTGKIIKDFTETINKITSPASIGSSNKTPTIMPSRSPTTKQGTVGIGNVPDPNYGNMGSIVEQLYFRAAA